MENEYPAPEKQRWVSEGQFICTHPHTLGQHSGSFPKVRHAWSLAPWLKAASVALRLYQSRSHTFIILKM